MHKNITPPESLKRAPRVPQRVQEAPNEPQSAALRKYWYSPPRRLGNKFCRCRFSGAKTRRDGVPTQRDMSHALLVLFWKQSSSGSRQRRGIPPVGAGSESAYFRINSEGAPKAPSPCFLFVASNQVLEQRHRALHRIRASQYVFIESIRLFQSLHPFAGGTRHKYEKKSAAKPGQFAAVSRLRRGRGWHWARAWRWATGLPLASAAQITVALASAGAPSRPGGQPRMQSPPGSVSSDPLEADRLRYAWSCPLSDEIFQVEPQGPGEEVAGLGVAIALGKLLSEWSDPVRWLPNLNLRRSLRIGLTYT